MFTTLAHLGHSHANINRGSMSDLDHYMPFIVGVGLIVAALLLIILYFLAAWQPKAKPAVKANNTAKLSTKKSSRKTK